MMMSPVHTRPPLTQSHTQRNANRLGHVTISLTRFTVRRAARCDVFIHSFIRRTGFVVVCGRVRPSTLHVGVRGRCLLVCVVRRIRTQNTASRVAEPRCVELPTANHSNGDSFDVRSFQVISCVFSCEYPETVIRRRS